MKGHVGENLIYYIIRAIALERFHIVMHSYAAWFSKKKDKTFL